jgi:hypothetical protein
MYERKEFLESEADELSGGRRLPAIKQFPLAC